VDNVINYFERNQQYSSGPGAPAGGYQVGDALFFAKYGVTDHAAMVSAVDTNGNITAVAESNGAIIKTRPILYLPGIARATNGAGRRGADQLSYSAGAALNGAQIPRVVLLAIVSCGPKVSLADFEAVKSLELVRLGEHTFDPTFSAAEDGDLMLLTGSMEGHWTALYRQIDGRWTWRADKGGAPADCLCLHDRDVALSATIFQSFAPSLLDKIVKPSWSTRGLLPDDFPCRFGKLPTPKPAQPPPK
jgi:hypothetical protein